MNDESLRLGLFTLAASLHAQGFYIGPRDPQRNRLHAGAWMICEDTETGPTDDASEGGFCIVGDDLSELIYIAGDCFV